MFILNNKNMQCMLVLFRFFFLNKTLHMFMGTTIDRFESSFRTQKFLNHNQEVIIFVGYFHGFEKSINIGYDLNDEQQAPRKKLPIPFF